MKGADKEVIVIGGGLGGLFTAAILSHEGYVVTVLEKNATAGGGLQTFRRCGFTFETGMHTLGGFNEGGSLDKICRYLGIRDELLLQPDDLLTQITYRASNTTYRLPYGREAFTEYLCGHFPHEAEGIKKLMLRPSIAWPTRWTFFICARTATICSRIPKPSRWPPMNLWRVSLVTQNCATSWPS